MSKYKIHIDKKSRTKKELEKDMNFDQLMGEYQKYYSPYKTRRLMFKDRKLIMLFVVIIAVALALYTSLKKENNKKSSPEPSSTESTGFTTGGKRVLYNG